MSDCTIKSLHKDILRLYDIRGILNDTLMVEDAYYIGRSFATKLHTVSPDNMSVCIACDSRHSSPMLYEALIEGLIDSGAQIISLGIAPTPFVYYASTILQSGGGIMVTGSHNPPEYNGFKFVLNNGPFFDQDIQDLNCIVESGQFFDTKGSMVEYDVGSLIDSYMNVLCQAIEHDASDLVICWDPGNGAASQFSAQLAEALKKKHGIKSVVINEELDGSFPSHHPDPTIADNLKDIQKSIQKNRAHVGFAFDGDGDRIGITDGEGNILQGDKMVALFGEEIIEKNPGATIIADVKSSQTIFDRINNAGGQGLMWKTGHSLIKSKIKETGALLAGEMSGHIFFNDKYYGYDDALYASVRFINLMAKTKISVKQFINSFPQSCDTGEVRIDCPESEKFTIMDTITKKLEQNNLEFCKVDGVRVSTSYGWYLIRASNTQNALIVRCESESQEGLTNLKQQIRKLLQNTILENEEF